MTTYSKRRGRRSLAAILAAMLIASVLAVVAGSPAQAANTSFEVLRDTNSDGVPDAREFAGQDRYDTALRLAKNFATAKGGLGAVTTAFISSGETLVDSISVAGLAGSADAPILLTPSGSLHGGVADFLEDYGVGTVYVLGGPVAVSDAVLTALEGLVSKPKVERIHGDDRYATAAAIASMIDSASSWCGTAAASAVLINGATDAMPFGVAVQTTAFRLRLPVLMTAADELSSATADYIRDNDIEHVQIIGGSGTVSDAVASALTSLGVDTVQRVEGDSASAVSVALAQLANNGCNDNLAPVSNNRVALVRGNPDGVVAAPVLASSLDSGNLVTPLVVGDSLPASVSDYLAATPKTVGVNNDKLNLGIVAIGGTAAVSADTMSAATTAAASSGALTVQIGAGDDPGTVGTLEGDTNGDGVTNADDPIRPTTANATFALYFSDDVTSGASASPASIALLADLRDVIEINGVPAVVTDAVTGASGGGCANNVVYVTLGQTLRDGDTVSIAASAHKLGTASDERTVVPASAKVQAAPADSTRPAVSIVAIADPAVGSTPAGTDFVVRIDDAGGLAADTLVATDFVYTPGSGSTNTAASALNIGAAAIAANAKEHETLVSLPNALVVGDRLTLKAGVVEDAAGNRSTTRSGSAIKAQASPRITSVLMSNPARSVQNSWTLPATAADGTTVNGGANAVTITAKASGDAAGAAGNAWSILFDTASTYDATKAVDIDVRVDNMRQRATVRFVNGPATVHDLVAAMKANSDFDSLFDVTIPCTGTTTTALAVNSANRDVLATSADAGKTRFAIEANFSAYIDSYTGAELLADVLAATAGRVPTAADVPALLLLAGFTSVPVTAADPAGPVTKVRYTFEIDNSTYLPQSRDLVMTTAATAAPSVAQGFAPDVAATATVNEQLNTGGQVRIAVSSSVKAS